ncbi:hypothetical protein SLEP1_g26247 [Rubroshorea leprosula]|uniref:Uncharacterized protein n=1 Tax=Rubroshorea leprosula TaxID=152421 RepID=A0AAV5JLI8_9ROSI|nr:hypothetical protein SLEP1_g26247 [Rubroshorea leprosula]
MWVGDFWTFFAREFPADPIGSSPNPPAPALLAEILLVEKFVLFVTRPVEDGQPSTL